ncbi:MAG: ADP-ribosylglycohydrolase family protein, partial [Clostridia bacterium]|nr:ADP-ribosylglycohydrolase family protein [Clostridia bacterium]
MTKDLNRFKGCMYGGAAGDALGYAVEFMNIEQVREAYGEQGITGHTLVGGKALVSDDTQMTLFTANGILVGMTEEYVRGSRRDMTRYLHNAYMDWQKTQRLSASASSARCCWLYNLSALHSVRAPGGTCLRSLSSGILGTIEHPINTSKGCGGVMRVAPIGLYFDPSRYRLEDIDMLGARSAALTHGHPLGFITAAALVHILHQIVYGGFQGDRALDEIVADCQSAMRSLFGRYDKLARLNELIDLAVELAGEKLPDAQAIARIGEGWVAEEALAIAIYCALKYRGDFAQALIASVNHSGDSDSTGSITGNILGAYLGYDAIPAHFISHLELADVIGEITLDLYNDCPMRDNPKARNDIWCAKY